jgi:hypothetical protein
MSIQLYAVGIYFNKSIVFKSDGTAGGVPTMSGNAILAAAAALGLRSKVLPNGLLSQLTYTPTSAADFRSGSTNTALIGYSLSLNQSLTGFPVPSQVLQYTSSIAPTTPVVSRPAFGTNGFKDGSDIRIRLLTIYEPATVTIWGAINGDGTIASSSGDFTVTKTGTGTYKISYPGIGFVATPSAVGSQNRFGSNGQSALDNVIFPFVSNTETTVIAGDSKGNASDRNFGFSITGVAAF